MNSSDPSAPATIQMDATQEVSVEEILSAQGNVATASPERDPQIDAGDFTALADSAGLGRGVASTATALPGGSPVRTGESRGTPFQVSTPSPAGAELTPTPIKPIAPIPPITLAKRTVCGRYVATAGAWRLELRVDVDGARPMKQVSGDYFTTTGGTVNYFGSFTVPALSLTVTSTTVTITGDANTTWATSFNKIKITIPRVTILQPQAAATVQWSNAAGTPGATYLCAFNSKFLRSVELEQDSETGITPFSSYNTGSLPSGGPARNLSIASAYAEAGIEMATAGVSNVIGAAPGGTWDDNELHNAMVTHFSLWKDAPQWKVWLFHASRYVQTSVLGIMFDQKGKQRQGCAVFYGHPLMNGTAPANLRVQLFCCVHELGHCFNFLHSFQKQYANPPIPNRLAALSWMNYPQMFPTGEAAFWAAFPFQFDDPEIVHIRHAFRNNVIMGGNPFGTGAALEALADFEEPVEDRSGIRLEIRTDRSFLLGEPVVVEFKLSADAAGMKLVHPHLYPDAGFVRLAVQKPTGNVLIYEPVMEQCIAPQATRLGPDTPALYDSAYIGYSKEGLVFDQPGIYKVRAIYAALDGSRVVSNTLLIKVRPPVTEDDASIADLYMGEEQGLLFYLLGSDSEHLDDGNAAIAEVAEKYPTHPLSVYSRLVQGFSLARPFKKMAADGTVTVRKPKPHEAAKLLGAVIDTSEKGRGVDNVTLSQTMCRLAKTQKAAGETKAAEETVKRATTVFRGKGLRPQIVNKIEAQLQTALGKE